MKKTLSLILLLAACFSAGAQPLPQKAVVDISANYMREDPSYDAENGTQALMGTPVDVLEKDGYWVKVRTPDGYKAWTTDLGLAFMDEQEFSSYEAAPKYICVAEYTHVYEYPSMNGPRVCDLTMGCILLKGDATTPSWAAVRLPSGRTGWVAASCLEDYSEWLGSREQSGENITWLAKKFVGVPYFWGGATVKGFDCSGLVQFVYAMHGRLLPRNASQQAFEGREVSVEISQMRPGDLIFFGRRATAEKPAGYSHVGIYLGDGRMIHSSHFVRISNIGNPEDPDYYDREILTVRRIFEQ